MRQQQSLALEIATAALEGCDIKRHECHERVLAEGICDIVYLYLDFAVGTQHQNHVIAARRTVKDIDAPEIDQKHFVGIII
jgi:hypothetical protein